MDVISSFKKVKNYCENEEFKGWDPYDGLNSKIFQATPLKKSKFARLAWIQFFKRNPINLRPLVNVPKEYNPKGLGLFLTGYCNLYQIALYGNVRFGTQDEIIEKINHLANLLIQLQSEGYSGSCWGYNFDWQARGGLYFPAETPNVVATTFATYGLLDAYSILDKEKIKNTAVTSAEFVINDLSRTEKKQGFLFSYAPKFGNNTVYNASLLGSKLLARVYSITNEETYKHAAKQSVMACCNAQNEDGSWYYGELPIQDWIDSFHTGFNLEALCDYQKYTEDRSFEDNLKKGFQYYLENFFLEDGTPKYYHNEVYPVDIHSPAQFLITLVKTERFEEHKELGERVCNWTIENMQDEDGYFYYQIKRLFKNKIPYMRWSQAWMFCALSYYLKNEYVDG
ncbi:delta-aminolevulinic acid dehydratase [Fodinibius saliphilus]|uniref:delta-aminolevulinic acid dehydratase n=1 Tax=Fodinibius saliphilus TaxID=1920650 RepID=UPI0011086742|nr:delta-aminolevulinic acid dehydratase [Fodinibius saliphilus]